MKGFPLLTQARYPEKEATPHPNSTKTLTNSKTKKVANFGIPKKKAQ